MNPAVRRMLAVVVLSMALEGVASAQSAPQDYKSRAVMREDGGLRVSVAVLSPEESEGVYGVPLASKSIQPVWIRIENHDDRAYYLMFPGLDPDFFPASEAAEAFGTSPAQQAELGRRFRDLGFRAVSLLRDFYEDTTEDAYVMQYRCRENGAASGLDDDQITRLAG